MNQRDLCRKACKALYWRPIIARCSTLENYTCIKEGIHLSCFMCSYFSVHRLTSVDGKQQRDKRSNSMTIDTFQSKATGITLERGCKHGPVVAVINGVVPLASDNKKNAS